MEWNQEQEDERRSETKRGTGAGSAKVQSTAHQPQAMHAGAAPDYWVLTRPWVEHGSVYSS
jgi:hypothetical protein